MTVPETEHIVHWAGPALRAANIFRQRCAWCGALLDEIDLDQPVAVPDGMEPPRYIEDDGTPIARWTPGSLVAVEQHGDHTALGVRSMWIVNPPDDGRIPLDSCMALPL